MNTALDVNLPRTISRKISFILKANFSSKHTTNTKDRYITDYYAKKHLKVKYDGPDCDSLHLKA